MQTLHKRLVFFVKWAWIVGVVVAAGFLLAREWDQVREMLRQVSLPLVAASIGLTAVAKLGLAQNARLAARRTGIDLGFATAARLYNLSQLGKYLPGSIWQFVGRAAAYRQLGAPYASIRDALLVESFWIVAAAALAGVVLAGPGMAGAALGRLPVAIKYWLAGGVLLALLAGCAVLVVKRAWATHYARLVLPSSGVLVSQALVWAALGLAFWALARACGLPIGAIFATGLFAGAYAIGFLVPFAPAGLGVRDGILTFGLLPYMPAGEALAVTVLARAVYLIVDVGLVLLQEPAFTFYGRRSRCSDE